MARVAIVLAGGDPVASGMRRSLPDDAYVVAADSGVHLADGLGLHVDCVVGDMDSADPAAVDAAERAGATIERHPAEKDATDLELALLAAQRHGVDRVVIVGGAGGRLDHFLANVALLASPRFVELGIEARFGDARVRVARGGGPPVEIEGSPGDLVTLLPAGGSARGVTTKGLQYPLHGDDLPLGTSRGVSNVIVDAPASVALDDGTLLVVQPLGGAS
jgi:thiamine pyrophosphokinase